MSTIVVDRALIEWKSMAAIGGRQKLRIRRYTRMEFSNLLSIQCKKNNLNATLDSLENLLDKGKSKEGIKGIIIQIQDGGYRIYYDGRSVQQKVGNNEEMLQSLCVETAINIRYEGNLSEYEREKEELDKVLNNNALEKISDSYCHVLQSDEEYDFMVMDVYIGVKDKAV